MPINTDQNFANKYRSIKRIKIIYLEVAENLFFLQRLFQTHMFDITSS